MRALLALTAAALAAAASIGAAPAAAQVAVAVTIAEDDESQRDIAAAVVQVAREKWRMLTPQLSLAQAKGCKAGDTNCLREVAQQGKASHLLVIGVAPLGVRDRVVAVQLFNVSESAPLFEESTVQPGVTTTPVGTSTQELAEVRSLAERLVAVAGPPPFVPSPPFVAVQPTGELSGWGWTGVVLVGVGGATAATSLITGGVMAGQRNTDGARDVFFFGVMTGGAIAALGTVAFVADGL